MTATPGPLGPSVLPPNPVFRFYEGGPGIDAIRGLTTGSGSGAPEDWVGSVTTVLGHQREGLATLADRSLLRDRIALDAKAYLGPEHVARFGATPGLLVKLLDAGERLAVHFHPGRSFAREQLHSQFGKTECWIILRAEPDAHMNLGLRADIDYATLERWSREQHSDEMLAALHRVPVTAGDVLFVPAGTLHTIGAGITLIELQEPTDMSVVLESRLFKVDDDEANLYLGWDRVLSAATIDATAVIAGSQPERSDHSSTGNGSRSTAERLLPKFADPYFRAQRLTLVEASPLELEPSFAILIALDGDVSLTSDTTEPLPLPHGQGVLVPYAAGTTIVSGTGSVIRCLPPAADNEEGQW